VPKQEAPKGLFQLGAMDKQAATR